MERIHIERLVILVNKKLTSKRKQQAAATRKKIESSAIELLKEYSLDDIGVTDICEKAGVSVGSFYHYFPSKDFVIFAIDECNQRVEEFEKTAEFTSVASDNILMTFRDQLEYVVNVIGIDTQVQLFKSQLLQYKLGNTDFFTGRPLEKLLTKLYEEGVRNGEFVQDFPASVVIGNLLHLYRGFLFNWCVQNGCFGLVDSALSAIYLFLRSFKK